MMMGGFCVSENGNIASLQHETIQVRIEPRSALLTITDNGGLTLRGEDWNRSPQKLQQHCENTETEISLFMKTGDVAIMGGRIRNTGSQALHLERLTVRFAPLSIGQQVGGHSLYKNGYQSWTASHSLRPDEQEMSPWPPPSAIMQENMRNRPSCAPGEFSADGYAILGKAAEGVYLLIGQDAPFDQFVYVRFTFIGGLDQEPLAEICYDFGRQSLAPGSEITLDPVLFYLDTHPNRIQDRYFDQLSKGARIPHDLPTGWCSWYFYYTKIDQAEMHANIDVARQKQVKWSHFVLDDGYQTEVGDWLSLNRRFSGGLAAIAEHMTNKGFAPGIWSAPFIAHGQSRIKKEHPEWFLKDQTGRPLWAGWNPLWGLLGNVYALDTTHPGFQEYLRQIYRTFVHEYGFRYLKLDFLFGASLVGNAYDNSLSPAQRLKLGYDIIREAAGDDIILLGCGSPLLPAIGKVDAMRIGPDVAPFWFANYRYHLTRDPHALCTKFAIRSILNRAQMHRKLWLNDPDCLMLRETETKLSYDERMTLTNAIAISGGMYLISDRLSALSDQAWDIMNKADTITRECDQGRVWTLDMLEREFPGWAYNTAGYLAAFNLEDNSEPRSLDLALALGGEIAIPNAVEDFWTGERIEIANGILDIGPLAPHASKLFRVITN
jgi:alpha-galactosidase